MYRVSFFMHRRWLVNRTNPEYIEYVSKIVSLSPVLTQVLINREIKTPQKMRDFLNPKMEHLSDPFELPGLKTAVERIKEASRRGERVLVHGDYDADGLSATAIVIHALKRIGVEVYYFIPHRITHGYGFGLAGVKRAQELGVKLIITVDCGITSFEAVALSKKEGIDVIITDHHEPALKNEDEKMGRWEDGNLSTSQPLNISSSCFLLPDAFTIVNPKLSTTDSRVSTLSGAGVAFKLAQALGAMGNESRVTSYELLDLAALGTMADVVPLVGENRILVKEGLKSIEDGMRPGLKALKEVSGINRKEIKSDLLPFTIIPRMNAAGRISDAHNVVKLLLTDSYDEAIEIASELDKLNAERQKTEEEVYQEALSKLNEKGVHSAIVLSSEGWHPGVIGIVASRIAEVFYRPAFIISICGSASVGSARSIPPFNVYEGLTGCRELLTNYGGHKSAAGFRLTTDEIQHFEEKMNKIVDEMLTEEDFIPSLEIDADVKLSHITLSLVRELRKIEPFGYGNSEPLLGSKGLEVLSPRVVGKNHLKMTLRQAQGRQKAHSIDAIGFDMAELFEKLETSTMIDALFTPLINEWEGGRYLQLNLKAFRPSL
ncbi:MAG: hypothetical protein FJ243_03925 [Nitrospira sp.]|nr:hypothetical protein [Nitrospira sp.]